MTGSSAAVVRSPDEMETLPWACAGLVPAAKPPSCLGAVLAGLAVVSAEVRVDPTQQYKRNFKRLVEQQNKAGAFVCFMRSISQIPPTIQY